MSRLFVGSMVVVVVLDVVVDSAGGVRRRRRLGRWCRRGRRRRRCGRRGRRLRRGAWHDLHRRGVAGVADQHDVGPVGQHRCRHLADETAVDHDRHADVDVVVGALVDLDDLVEVARADADDRRHDTRVVPEERDVVVPEQLLVVLDRRLGGHLVAALGVDLVTQLLVLLEHVLVVGDAPPRVAHRPRDDVGGSLERLDDRREPGAGSVEHGVAAQVERQQQGRREQQQDDRPATSRRVQRHRSVRSDQSSPPSDIRPRMASMFSSARPEPMTTL